MRPAPALSHSLRPRQWFDGMHEGRGRETHADGSYFEGEFGNSKWVKGKYTTKDGRFEFVGGWKDGMRHGSGTCALSGKVSRAPAFRDPSHWAATASCFLRAAPSLRISPACASIISIRFRFRARQYKYKGAFVADAREGKGTCRYANGDEYEGEWKVRRAPAIRPQGHFSSRAREIQRIDSPPCPSSHLAFVIPFFGIGGSSFLGCPGRRSARQREAGPHERKPSRVQLRGQLGEGQAAWPGELISWRGGWGEGGVVVQAFYYPSRIRDLPANRSCSLASGIPDRPVTLLDHLAVPRFLPPPALSS